MESSMIAKFYTSKTILITGGTGFMGKILIEKLLRSCPNLTTIYLLIRPKKNKAPNQRLNDLISCPIFDKLRNNNNDNDGNNKILSKLSCIPGDITYQSLNLSNDDRTTLENTIDIVFHMAANVRFDQPLKPAVQFNIGGTKNVLDLVCNFKKLQLFLHVSTSYCHCNEVELYEKLYEAPHHPREILDLVQWMDDDLLKSITPKLIKNFPNTYAYTKNLTEHLLNEYKDRINIVLTRPSIVVACYKEPIPGWVDNLNGPTGLLVGAGKGVIRSMHCNPNFEADIVPVDIVINTILAIGWKTTVANNKITEIDVYHITANRDYPICWGEALEIGRKHVYDNPFSVCLWYPGGSIKSSYLLHAICVFFLHIIPAYMIDFLMFITGNKPFLIQAQKRIQNGLEVLQYYTTRPWYFHNEKMIKLWNDMTPIDKETFYMNRTKIDFNQYILNYVLGARQYCVHEKPETIPYAKKVLKRLYYLDLFKNLVLFGLFGYFIFIINQKFFDGTDKEIRHVSYNS